MERKKQNIVNVSEKYKKILIVHIKESNKYIDEKRKKDINNYLKNVDFEGVKNIDIEKINDFKVKVSLNNFIYSYSEFFKSNSFKNIILTLVGSIIAYFFYVLGYVFLYSYSFPGEVKESSIFQIFIAQVPFNFKVDVAIGVLILIIMILLFIPLINIFIKRKKLFVSWTIYIAESIANIMSIYYLSFSQVNTNAINFVNLVIVVCIFPILLFAEIYILGMFDKSYKLSIVSWGGSFILSILLNRVINDYSIIVILFIFINACISFVINLLLKNKDEGENGKAIMKNYNKNNYPELLLVVGMVLIFLSGSMMFKFVADIGVIAGTSFTSNSLRRVIQYEDGSGLVKEIEGDIVTQDSNNYYISLGKEKRLLVVRSKSLIKICDEDKIYINNVN